MLRKHTLVAAAVAAILPAPMAQATNGYFAHGYGTKNKALAGAGAALPANPVDGKNVAPLLFGDRDFKNPNAYYPLTIGRLTVNPAGTALTQPDARTVCRLWRSFLLQRTAGASRE